jgi:RNA polymerase sigma-32 factor
MYGAPGLSRKVPNAPKKPRVASKTSAQKGSAEAQPTEEPVSSIREESEAQDDDDVVVGEITADLSDDSVIDVEPRSLPRATGAKGIDRYDPMTAYLSEVQRHPLLTPEEEQELSQRYVKTGDVKAAARMVTANLRLVVKIAYEYRRAYKNIMDIVQEGNIGLMQAVKRYDPYRGVKLSSYAAWWIRAYILRFILNNWRLVKLGTTQTQRKLFFNLSKEKQRLSAMGIDPTSNELARRLEVPENELIEMDRRLSGSDVSLDTPVGAGDGRSATRVDLMPAAGRRADDILAGAQIDEMVREKLKIFEATLTGKDIDIFHDRLMADEPLTLQEIGDRYGISRERVRQLEKRLQDRLKAYLQGELGEALDLA